MTKLSKTQLAQLKKRYMKEGYKMALRESLGGDGIGEFSKADINFIEQAIDFASGENVLNPKIKDAINSGDYEKLALNVNIAIENLINKLDLFLAAKPTLQTPIKRQIKNDLIPKLNAALNDDRDLMF